MTICSPTPAPASSRSHPVFWFTSLLCVKHWVVDRCVFYRLLNAYVFNVSALQMPFSCVREILWFPFAKRGMSCPPRFTFSMILTLLRSTCIVLLAKLFPLTDKVLLYLLNHCACEALRRYDCITWESGVFSLEPGRKWRCHPFLLPLALLVGTVVVFLKPDVCVWQCHRREGGAEDVCTSLLLNCLRCKREKTKTKADLTLHCTKICVRFLSYFYRGGNCWNSLLFSTHVWIFVLHPYWYELFFI